jgi:hypothetical protein
MSAAVRPLLFWLRSNNVGAARIVWRGDDDGRRGYELLLGSDPRRAPRRVNRWGWVREDVTADAATMVGLMRKTDAETLDEARSHVAAEGKSAYAFKAIKARVADGRGQAENTVWLTTTDYTYRDLGDLQRLVASSPQAPPRVRSAQLPEGTRPGFLSALAELVERSVAIVNGPDGPLRLPKKDSLPFTFNAALYDLKLLSSQWVPSATYGGRTYRQLVRLNFESFNRELRTRERFTLVCGTDGTLTGVPVFITYQPKWWFKAEGFLEEAEAF